MKDITPHMPAKRALAVLGQPEAAAADVGAPKRISKKRSAPPSTIHAARAGALFPAGIALLHQGDETWSGYFTWENIPGWRWRTKTSKSKYRSAAVFDLTNYDLLLPLLGRVEQGQRAGPIVKGGHGLLVRYRTYAKTLRRIAEVAGMPFEVKNIDAAPAASPRPTRPARRSRTSRDGRPPQGQAADAELHLAPGQEDRRRRGGPQAVADRRR
jgi:hypothetical protein